MRMTTLLLVALAIATPSSLLAAGGKVERRSLVGLPPIAVLVEDVAPELATQGITASQLRVDSELRLRKSGIRVTDSESAPFLHVNVTAMKATEYVWAFAVDVSLNQEVTLPRSPSWLSAITWHQAGLSTLGLQRVGSIREHVLDYVDMFINDYLAANPSGKH
jgi:hypothetical protein